MQRLLIITIVLLALPLIASAQQKKGVYSYVDENGNLIITDRPPPEASEIPKDIVNEHGVTVGTVEGKKSAEELAAEKRAAEYEMQIELQRRADKALLVTYQSVEEIELHRDRRLELFQAQARVTELYLRNQRRALDVMRRNAGQFKPYSADPNAATIDPGLVEDIKETEATIERHLLNLKQYRDEERRIIEEFEGDITRFKELKGITLTAAHSQE